MACPALDLYWIPLGAGARVVQTSGRIYEALVAWRSRRPRRPLYHSALVATTEHGEVVMEMTPVTDARGRNDRGVVAEGPVGLRPLGRFRLFRYEIRRWPGGVIADLAYSVASPVRITEDARAVRAVLHLVPLVPVPVWGLDELHAGEMWNSNSVVSWLLASAGLSGSTGEPPDGGRAPGWDAGVAVARRNAVEVGTWGTGPPAPGARS